MVNAKRGRPQLVIYTDGGASPNPGAGGWAAVILLAAGAAGREARELSGGAPSTTNNRMELQAAISALDDLAEPSVVDLYTDSQYVRQGVTSWLARWRARNWRRPGGGEVKNLDLWRRLDGLNRRHRVRWHWVKGHAGNKWNERVDALASAAIAARGGGEAAEPDAEVEMPPESARIFLKVRCTNGRGAWAAEVEAPDGSVRRAGGRASETTSNRLELACAVDLLESLPARQPAAVLTGSDYLRRGALRIPSWKRNQWRAKAGGQVKNLELWHRLARQLEHRRVVWPPPVGAAAERLTALKTRLRASF